MSVMLQRKSIREFTDTKITEEQITALLTSGMQAPSAKNQQPWDYIVVDDKELLAHLSTMHKGSWPLKTAPLAIIPVLRENTINDSTRYQCFYREHSFRSSEFRTRRSMDWSIPTT